MTAEVLVRSFEVGDLAYAINLLHDRWSVSLMVSLMTGWRVTSDPWRIWVNLAWPMPNTARCYAKDEYRHIEHRCVDHKDRGGDWDNNVTLNV